MVHFLTLLLFGEYTNDKRSNKCLNKTFTYRCKEDENIPNYVEAKYDNVQNSKKPPKVFHLHII